MYSNGDWLHRDVQVPSRSPQETRREFIIDRSRLRHFAPAELHPYHRDFDHLYREWLGREMAWERVGRYSFAVPVQDILNAALMNRSLRVPVGDPPPVIEMLIEQHPGGREVFKVMPRHLLRPVSERDWTNSGGKRALAGDVGHIEMAPRIILQTMRVDEAGAFGGALRRSFACPIALLFRRSPGRSPGGIDPFTVYCHTFGDLEQED